MNKMTVGWKTSSLNPAIASLRYRALFPLLALEGLGFKNKICTRVTRSFLVDLDVLVIVKSFTLDDYWLAQEASKLGVPVVFDLCDNIFIEKYGSGQDNLPANIFLLISSVASAITVTTAPLAAVVRTQTGGGVPVYIVPDGIESEALLRSAEKRLFLSRVYRSMSMPLIIARIFRGRFRDCYTQFKNEGLVLIIKKVQKKICKRLDRLPYKCLKFGYRMNAKLRDRRIKRIPNGHNLSSKEKINPVNNRPIIPARDSKKILWFGNHGAAHAKFGMMDLLTIRGELENIANELSVELIVVSNNIEKYNEHILPMAIPSRYFEWSAEAMMQHFADADVVVVPSSKDDFSICKSANRTVLSINNGVPVVATSTPALDELSEVIIYDDFASGIRRYLMDKDFSREQVEKGKDIIDRLYGQKSIGDIWAKVINSVVQQGKYKRSKDFNPELIVVIHLPQDISLALPVLEEARHQGLKCVIWTNITSIKRWPSILKTIQSSGFDFSIIADSREIDALAFPSTVYALLSITESNLNPHVFTHQLAKAANKAGIYTVTMQHGFENIGLTYSDEIHNIKRIYFESSHIYTWGDSGTLHPDILQETLKKCVHVGCSKPKNVEFKPLPFSINTERTVVGVFENLHWHRYSDEYRTAFIDGVNYLAASYPDVMFIVKPHNAGMWLTARYKGGKPEHSNVLIVDSLSSDWADITAAHLLPHLSAAITTPSTVALDTARVGMPTAVFAQELELDNYNPLFQIKNVKDWSEFVSQVLNCKSQKILQEKSNQFVKKVLLPSDESTKHIVNDIKSHKINHIQEGSNAA